MTSFEKLSNVKKELKEFSKDISILIAEDDLLVNELLRESLSKSFQKIHFANNGKDGIELFKKHNDIDIVLSDVMMPIIDGIEMVSEIKKINPNVKIILISANNDVDNVIRAIGVGIEYFILKPLVIVSLKEILLKVVKRVVLEKEHEKNKLILQRKEKLARMGELISSIAHQWRQPLNAFNTELLKLRFEAETKMCIDNEMLIESIKKMNRYSQKMSETITNFINFVKPEFKKEFFTLKSVIYDLEIMFQEQFVKNKIKFILDIQDDLNIFGFRSDMLDILINLISNSIDSLVENCHDNRYIVLKAYHDDIKIVISIDDNGGGLKKEAIDRIFEPYFTTKDENVKSGLGLYIVHSMINLNFNGDILFENRENDGVRFDIILPKINEKG